MSVPAEMVCAATFPLHPNQMPDLCLSAALTATSSPPARRLRIFLGNRDSIRDYD
jgi:hypothetical protein